ncbi:hypothetical protein GOQ29_07425 [Clostridium sp. D2Q-14]|uniref:hypothetical protein n=1 Tax=Anaeromonas gelatinilytica TaxID=2683194 RepID=UPI00193B35D1|nr:hypothetical protein [Anaeromonas gelatinilytica]MBS4535449.1 hypothetical protein [Anaeromonas gelatinilytica]
MQKIKITDVAILFLGMGIGIIFTAIVFYFNPKIEYKEYTDEEIVSKYTEIKLKDDREHSNSLDNNQKEDSKHNKEQKEEKKIKKLVIDKGESINDIIDKLYELHIIDNKESFLDRLKERKATQKIEYGKYEIEIPISYDEIIDEIILK